MRSLHVLNLLLALVVLALATAVARTVLDRGPAGGSTLPLAETGRAAAPTPDPPPEPGGELRAATAADFDVILRHGLFGKPLPEATARPETVRTAAPPAPLPALIGTVIVGDERRALLKDGSRTDLFAPGDAVAAGTLVEIHADRIVVRRGESLGEVSLKTSITPVPAAPSPAVTDPTDPRPSRRPHRGRHPAPAAPLAPAADGAR